ncbi:MAG: FadR family transcriptional regulator [Roseitalea sp.]|nr:FadR family transcriptional regulator [Roseitalea sp.]MBO6721477.1 FadR family transcriptional regulator [Roseitalea sp.]MBO6742034.1 FadR family transcriptional regulator [Roseitalea sp.]
MADDPFKFDTLRRDTLSSQVAARIQERIENGLIGPDSQLPSERALSESFEVSRVAVREAIQLMQAKGYIEVRHGKGSYVVDPAIRKASTLASWMGGREQSLLMMVELRRIVEPGIVELAARNASPADAAALIEQAHELETCPRAHLSDTDAAFHKEIARMTGNDLVFELLTACLERTAPLRERTLKDRERRHLAAAGHVRIAEAIAAGDPEAARNAMLEHMSDALRSL